MIHFQVDNIKMDVESGGFSMDMESPIFAEGVEVLPPAFSFPVKISLHGKNVRWKLGYQDMPAALNIFKEIENVQLYIGGLPFFTGKLVIIDMDRDFAECSFMTNNLSKVKETKLNELDNLGNFSILGASNGVMLSHLRATTLVPSGYNHIFVPVFNPSYMPTEFYTEVEDLLEPITIRRIFGRVVKKGKEQEYKEIQQRVFMRCLQNPYHNGFKYGADARAITPFVKIHHIFTQIFDYIGLRIDDQVFDDELKKMYLYNNSSLNRVDEEGLNFIDNKIEYKLHVPEEKILDFLKELNTTLSARIIPGIFERKFKYVFLKDIVTGPVQIDWSSRLVDIRTNYAGEGIADIGYEEDTSDTYFTEPSEKTVIYTQDGSETVGDLELYYEQESNTYHNEPLDKFSNFFTFWYKKFKKLVYGTIGKHITSKLSPLFTTTMSVLTNNYVTYFASIGHGTGWPLMPSLPMINTQGNCTYVNDDFEKVSISGKASMRIVFYRGYQTGIIYGNVTGDITTGLNQEVIPHNYPYATGNIFGPFMGRQLVSGQVRNLFSRLNVKHSLLWNGDFSLAEKADPFYKLIKDGRTIKARLKIPVKELLNFEWDKVVKIQTNNYLVKKLHLELLEDGKFLIDADLVRL